MITNIHKATLIDGSPLNEDDLKEGVEIFMKNGSGVLRCKCVENTDEKAVFDSLNPDWPYTYIMDKQAEDLTLDEFESLKEALLAFSAFGNLPTDEQRDIVIRADQLGYANYISFTQAHWTKDGISAYHDLENEYDQRTSMSI